MTSMPMSISDMPATAPNMKILLRANSSRTPDNSAYTARSMTMLAAKAVVGERYENSTSLFIFICRCIPFMIAGISMTLLKSVRSAIVRSISLPPEM